MLDHLRIGCGGSLLFALGLALILSGCFLWQGPGVRNGLAGPIVVSVTYETGASDEAVLEPGGAWLEGSHIAFTRIEVRSQECGNLVLDEPEVRSRQRGFDQGEQVVWHVTDCEVVPIGRDEFVRLSP